jgi:hypothetical protein
MEPTVTAIRSTVPAPAGMPVSRGRRALQQGRRGSVTGDGKA